MTLVLEERMGQRVRKHREQEGEEVQVYGTYMRDPRHRTWRPKLGRSGMESPCRVHVVDV